MDVVWMRSTPQSVVLLLQKNPTGGLGGGEQVFLTHNLLNTREGALHEIRKGNSDRKKYSYRVCR